MREKPLLLLISLSKPYPTNYTENHQKTKKRRQCSHVSLDAVLTNNRCCGCGLDANLHSMCMLQSFRFFVLLCCCVCSNCVWEPFWWSVGGSCKKDSRYVCAKGQVLYASALTVKSHLRQNKAEWVNAKGLKTLHLEQKRQEGDTNGNSGVCLRLYKSIKKSSFFIGGLLFDHN